MGYYIINSLEEIKVFSNKSIMRAWFSYIPLHQSTNSSTHWRNMHTLATTPWWWLLRVEIFLEIFSHHLNYHRDSTKGHEKYKEQIKSSILKSQFKLYIYLPTLNRKQHRHFLTYSFPCAHACMHAQKPIYHLSKLSH